MKQLFLCAFVVAVALTGTATHANDNADQRIEALMEMLSGNFDAGRHRQDERLAGIPEERLSTWASRSFAPMTAPAIGSYVMLSASYNRYGGEWRYDPYEFLVWTLETDPNSDDILMTPKAPLGAQSYERSARIPGILDGIQPGGLVNGTGGAACPIRWAKTDVGFYGVSKDCLVMSVSQLKVLNWNWTYDLTQERLQIELAGRDKDDGTFLFGTREGQPSVLYRLSDVSEFEAARYMLENPSGDADQSMAEDLLRAVLEANPRHTEAQALLDGLQSRDKQ